MVEIFICMGSACYLKGSEDIVKIFKEEISKNSLDAEIRLKGSFCLGPCNQGVVVKVKDHYFKLLNPQNAKKIFESQILPYIKEIEGDLNA
ncbi:Thioredoxin-like [2Fe-2S] ferredoxin [Marinitoga hydrogenitolerans DSM 16785]|uniref:Thioredoxin-like [2Fe-2S] ferredoxin n=1 Tax=Marinitoga hydrogenitolerans (strain DSM 16785 / JCM 12826 / AT1271) TaxID=1122195 RepID=A0A1M4SZJ8_MARH1|nr:(2Fe-2S) ferredoxin domain-containing protein [Marinitoga hydrogenitolerans]SHE37615.1 Thioredoxin-like [2Fe-2S] ferredoxin [Marinitoga hydrogenitolerans DSM 16785]